MGAVHYRSPGIINGLRNRIILALAWNVLLRMSYFTSLYTTNVVTLDARGRSDVALLFFLSRAGDGEQSKQWNLFRQDFRRVG